MIVAIGTWHGNDVIHKTTAWPRGKVYKNLVKFGHVVWFPSYGRRHKQITLCIPDIGAAT